MPISHCLLATLPFLSIPLSVFSLPQVALLTSDDYRRREGGVAGLVRRDTSVIATIASIDVAEDEHGAEIAERYLINVVQSIVDQFSAIQKPTNFDRFITLQYIASDYHSHSRGDARRKREWTDCRLFCCRRRQAIGEKGCK